QAGGGLGLETRGSTGVSLDPLLGALAGARGGAEGPSGWHADALRLALVGLAAMIVKAAAGAWASREQGRICGEVGTALRTRVLGGWLALHRLPSVRPAGSPRHFDQGVARDETDHDDFAAHGRAHPQPHPANAG